eukprot:scaffold193623_cov22-Prasinocladus_malaysianus.AAC.1
MHSRMPHWRSPARKCDGCSVLQGVGDESPEPLTMKSLLKIITSIREELSFNQSIFCKSWDNSQVEMQLRPQGACACVLKATNDCARA